MRVGLVNVVRRVWAPVGVKVRQKVQQVRQWRYLVVAIEVWSGRLWWCWTDTMRSEEIVGVVRGWQQNTDLKAVAWDGAWFGTGRRQFKSARPDQIRYSC